jgi:hypothetical protein
LDRILAYGRGDEIACAEEDPPIIMCAHMQMNQQAERERWIDDWKRKKERKGDGRTRAIKARGETDVGGVRDQLFLREEHIVTCTQ